VSITAVSESTVAESMMMTTMCELVVVPAVMRLRTPFPLVRTGMILKHPRMHGSHSIGRFLEFLLADGPVLVSIESREKSIDRLSMVVRILFGR
jgi:hypothetical protein